MLDFDLPITYLKNKSKIDDHLVVDLELSLNNVFFSRFVWILVSVVWIRLFILIITKTHYFAILF